MCGKCRGIVSTFRTVIPICRASVTITHRAPATHRASTCKFSKLVRHALFVAFHYPPEASSSGVLRTLKYSRYLAEYGWRVSVITLDPSAYTVCDPQLESQIPAGVRVVRTRYINTQRHLSIRGIYPAILALPDRWIGWWPWAVAAGHRLLKEDSADLIYSTSPQPTAHLIAMRLASAHRLPWVTDFRDPWIEDPPSIGTPTGRVFLALDRYLERRVIERCAHVVTSTARIRDVMRLRYPKVPADKITAILNGYDEADFADRDVSDGARSDKLLIVHAGTINSEFRDPRPLLRALRLAADQGTIQLDRVRLRFVGSGAFGESSEMRVAVADNGLVRQVEFVGRVPYEQALRELRRADLLLLLQASEDTTGLVPAKLYEYLRAQKPVLALVWPGSSNEVLAMTGGGWAIDPRQPEALTAAVANVYQAWCSGMLKAHCADLNLLRRFDRKKLAGELAGVFDQAMGHGLAS
jgi:glycosyltransferase involved in cell wall biosynthesis